MGPDPAVAAVRRACHADARSDLAPGDPVLVACSGGADSLALLDAAAWHARDGRNPVVGVTVDHGLQDGSAEVAERVVRQMAELGATETVAARVRVQSSGQGPEAAAREARYAVLEELAERFGAVRVLLGHTLDDQAETVLLGLGRGSGGRSLRGMRRRFGVFARPLLDLSREQTRAACVARGLDWWEDPHNDDPRFARARVRHRVLPVLEAELGPGVAGALARTADQLADDVQALDALAAEAMAGRDPAAGLSVDDLLGRPRAVRTRMLRLAALAAGSPPGELFAVHVDALEAQLHNADRLPREIQLPGHVRAVRAGRTLRFDRRPPSDASPDGP